MNGLKDRNPQARIPDRKLGASEAFLHRFHEELFGGPAILCVPARIAGPLDIQLVKHACRYLWERHPLLRARIAPGTDGPRFVFDVPFHDIPVHSFFELGRTGVHAFVEREADTLFDTSRHLWRALLITDKTGFDRHYLVLSLHHSISDRTCAVALTGELIGHCAKLFAGGAVHVDALPVRPALEEHIASAAAQRPGGVRKRRLAPPDDLKNGTVPFHEYLPPGRRHTRFRVHAVGPQRLQRLQGMCLQEKTTVTSALSAMALMTMQKRFGGDASFEIETPVSLRHLGAQPIGDDEISCLTSNIGLEYSGVSGQGSLWLLARDCEEQLCRIMSQSDSLLPGEGFQGDKTIEELRTARQFPLSCLLADIGQVSLAPTDPFVIEDLGFLSGRQSAEHLMFISAAMVRDDLSLSFAYTSPLIRDSWADRFINDFLHLMDRAVK